MRSRFSFVLGFGLFFIIAGVNSCVSKGDCDTADTGDGQAGCPNVCFEDLDGDGFGQEQAIVGYQGSDIDCDHKVAEGGVVWDDGDCDDTDPTIYPGAIEECDGDDNDCDGETDEPDAIDARTWYLDEDGDNYGVDETTVVCNQPSGYGRYDGDCDDADATVYPYAEEVCDGYDNDCDGEMDEDEDGDGYTACSDCDDSDASDNSWDPDADQVYPGAPETCNDVDDDCDGETDEPDAIDARTWYLDEDGDNYGVDETTVVACERPAGYAGNDGDCDSTSSAYNPGATEDDCFDPHDYNCDGSVGYADYDGDGYVACNDCDDTDASVWLGAGCP